MTQTKEIKCKNFWIIKLLSMIFVFIIPLYFAGCATSNINKDNAASAEICQEPSFEYDSVNNVTNIVFVIRYENNTIYCLKKEKVLLKLYHGETFVRNIELSWANRIRTAKPATVDVVMAVLGEVDDIELYEFVPIFCDLWESYSIVWILTVIVPIVMSILYLIVVLKIDLSVKEIFGDIWILLGIVVVSALSCLVSYLISKNWFAVIICLIAIGLMFGLCFAMSGIRAIVKKKQKNEKSFADKTEEKIVPQKKEKERNLQPKEDK